MSRTDLATPSCPMPTHPARASELARLHREESFLIVLNAWDAASARAAERAGALCVGTTSGGLAAAHGYADGEFIPRSLVIESIGRMASITTLPLTADLEAGFGETPEQVGETIRLALEAGVAGFNLEDSLPASKRSGGVAALRDLAEQLERLHAAREACEALGVPDAVINARLDVFLREVGAPERRVGLALERAAAYVEAGARCIFPIGVRDGATIAELTAGIGAPVNVLALPGVPSLRELQALGVRRVSVGTGWHRYAIRVAEEAARAVLAGSAERLWEPEG